MAAIGLVVHPDRSEAHALAADTARWLGSRDHDVRLSDEDAKRCGMPELGWDERELVVGLDLLMGFGGDGTILRAADLGSDDGVPVLGVNVGQLGYLTVVEPTDVRMALKRFLSGDYDVEERMRLASEVQRADGSVEAMPAALNEVVVERSAPGHSVRLDVSLDAAPFTSYVTDGLIVATPTGSTAYAFSVRGPIIAPRHRAILLTPVSPHMLFDRSLVLEPDTEVRLRVEGSRAAQVAVDGRGIVVAHEGDTVVCTAARASARLVVIGRRDFHRVLRSKFGLADR
jgi:NAD+ kinase